MKFRKIIEFQSSWLVTELHIFLIIDEKELFNIHKISKINCKINQELKLWARRKCPYHLTACVNRWTLWKYYLFVIFSFKRNTRVKTNEIRNIQLSLFFTGFSKCNFYRYRFFQKLRIIICVGYFALKLSFSREKLYSSLHYLKNFFSAEN